MNNLTKEEKAAYNNTRLPDILVDIANNLVSGHLESNRTFKTRKPIASNTIRVSAKSLTFEFANKVEIEALQIKPEGMSVSEIEQEIKDREAMLDSLLSVWKKVKDMYQRDVLFVEIKCQVSRHRAQFLGLR